MNPINHSKLGQMRHQEYELEVSGRSSNSNRSSYSPMRYIALFSSVFIVTFILLQVIVF